MQIITKRNFYIINKNSASCDINFKMVKIKGIHNIIKNDEDMTYKIYILKINWNCLKVYCYKFDQI